MSKISYERFLTWCEDRFGDVSISGDEIKVNSIFCEDYKKHLWMNVVGGKKKKEFGVFHCFKSNRKGSLISLVMLVDHCTFEEALATLESGLTIWELSDEIDKLFSTEKQPVINYPNKNDIPLPESTFRISQLPENDYYRIKAESYLKNRGLPIGKMMICEGGIYKDRLIIPYFKENTLIYWNGRYIGNDKEVIRYMGPPKEIGVGKSDVIYWASTPQKGSKIYLTEGEFCAESFKLADLSSGAFGGKSLSEKQAEMLRGYQLCLCLDNDGSGEKATETVGEYFIKFGFKDISYVRPPNNYKDWNELMVKTSPSVLRAYVEKYEKSYDSFTSIVRGTNAI